ncbi:MAG: RsmB/NOP family class I SAM-dependent RNA methyltransferase [Alphaproteobacteria bacterium]|nr:RsmB/NOP family class I SAM-dependent RNA methyltransferase [Alphaproteobacteria bacterium]MDE2629914.1 RsmB/NOP family class I SAM-dependent RNA methyltransferase [Alphaproteobacteria bacterium]
MTPAARLQAVIDVLQGLEATAQPADRFLHDFFRARRYMGAKDRAAVSERTYAVLRHRSSFAWRMDSGEARSLVIASLAGDGLSTDAIAALFDGNGYGPAVLSGAERRALSSPPDREPPLCVRGEFPPFLEAELSRAFGPALPDEMTAMQARAPVDLRVNTLKASREAVLEALRAEGFAVDPTPYAPMGLRLPPGAGSAKLSAMPHFAKGAFEFQDEAAQIAAILCAAKPGMRVLDLAAGAGGKSLALAAAMKNIGEVVAHDANPARLRPLVSRATRAGATIVRPRLERPQGAFDVVLIDSPCSGSGTWRRQPELRWRITPDGLKALMGLQDDLLEHGAALVAAGGRLVYATCSLLPCENEDRTRYFLSRRADFDVVPASSVWLEAVGTAPPPGLDRFFKATPLQTGTDGFFTAVLRRER